MKRKLTQSEEWYTTSDKEREAMKICAFDYIIECHYDELEELIKLN